MIRKYGILVLTLMALSHVKEIAAQDSSVRELPEFVFTEQKQKLLQEGFNRRTLDSAVLAEYRSRNLADYLSEQSPIFIKSYGLGSLATISLRGSAASQTAVIWNGLNLQSPMNGQIDLALLPAFFFDRAEVQYGSSSASWGSGAVGGALIMNSDNMFGKGLIAGAGFTYGSFSSIQGMIKAAYGGKRFFIHSRYLQSEAENDFSFRNRTLPGSPILKQINAALRQDGLMTEAGFIPKLNNNIIIRHWHQNSHRDIPPVLSQQKAISFQEDKNERLSLEWNRTSGLINSLVKAAYLDETIDFLTEDSSFNHNRARSFIALAEISLKISRHFRTLFSAYNNYSRAESNGFNGIPSQNRTAVFGTVSGSFLRQKLKTQLTLREELAGDQWVPFTPSFSVEYEYLTGSRMGANVSRTYRLPTFNDLFWNTGNPDLLPESGWNGEAFINYRRKLRNTVLEASAAVFTRKIDNWIIWLPKVGFWTPQNVASVWSRGFECFGKAGWKRGIWQYSVDASFSYVRSTNVKARMENDASVGKQLLYVPETSAQGRLMISRKTLRLSVSTSYTGFRYISTDNSDYLDPYILLRARLSWQYTIFNCQLDLFAEASNLGAQEYQVVAQRPMPGRSYTAGFYINLSNLKSCCKKPKP